MDALQFIGRYKREVTRVLKQLPEDGILSLIDHLETALREDRQVFICGNGGSAATASHFANDLGKGASYGRSKRFRVLSLTDNVPWISALANDTDYSQVFVEQLKNFARPQDLLIAFSGSGNSPNIIEAVRWANAAGLLTIGLTGRPGGLLGQEARETIFVESSHMGHIEDGHFLIQHFVGYFLMERPDPA